MPLILGLVLLLLVGPGLIIGGIIGTAGGAASQISDPIAFEGGQMQTPIEPMEMVIVYVPEAVADQTECLGEGVVPGSIVSQETQGTVVLGDGNTYRQQVSFSSTQSTTLTVTCSGPDGGPLQYVGPMNSLWMVAPLFIGVGLGILAGTIGLVLTIVGIVQRRRSARA